MKVAQIFKQKQEPRYSVAFYMKADEVIIIAFNIKILLRICLALIATSIHSFLEIRDLEKISASVFVLILQKDVHFVYST